MRVPIGVPEGVVWGGVQVGGGGVVFLSKMRDKGKGVGRVGHVAGRGKGTGKSMRTNL